MFEDDLDTPVTRTGGKAPGAFPHLCVYAFTGAEKAQCAAFSGVYRRNIDGCCAAKCNSAERKCRKCVEEARKPIGLVTDPNSGLCAAHLEQQQNGGKPLPAIQRPPVSNPRVPVLATAPNELQPAIRRKAAMPRSTPAQMERITLLDPDERFVLERSAYGYGSEDTEGKLLRKPDRSGRAGYGDIVDAIIAKLQIPQMERSSERLRAAAKIFLDAKEAGTDPVRPVAAYEEPDAAEDDALDDVRDAADEEEDDDLQAGEYPAAEDRRANAQTTTTTRNTQGKDTDVQQDSARITSAKALATTYAKARNGGAETPLIATVYDAVRTLLEDAGMSIRGVGELFGYQGASATSWAMGFKNLSRLDQGVWKRIEGMQISFNALKNISLLRTGEEQRNAIDALLAKREVGAARHPQHHASNGRETPSVTAEPAPAAPPATTLPVLHKEEPMAAVVQHQTNGHAVGIRSLLPVRISIQELGDLADFDLAAVTLGDPNAQDRAAQLKRYQDAGFVATEVLLHPAMPPHILFTKRTPK